MGNSTTCDTDVRYAALDGLRGLAALVVVAHHCLLVSPNLAAAAAGGVVTETWVWWITFTPLHVFWAGKEAVYVFFILSGFVLTIPFVGNAKPAWPLYFLKRILRIYPPVWASLILALIMAWAFPRVAGPEYSWWVNLHDESPNVFRDALLLGGAGSLNSPLWSLHWEMTFSLLLPLYVVAAERFQHMWFVGIAVLAILIGAAEFLNVTGVAYLLVFGIGALMATRRDLLSKWGRSLGHWDWAGLLGTAIVLLCSRWLFPQLPVHICLAALGGALLIFTFIAWQPALSMGSTPLLHWLGLRSFSLYLVHEPIVVSVSLALHSSAPLHVVLLALPLSVLVTEVFFRLVERPSLRFSRAVSRTIGHHISRRDEKPVARP